MKKLMIAAAIVCAAAFANAAAITWATGKLYMVDADGKWTSETAYNGGATFASITAYLYDSTGTTLLGTGGVTDWSPANKGSALSGQSFYNGGAVVTVDYSTDYMVKLTMTADFGNGDTQTFTATDLYSYKSSGTGASSVAFGSNPKVIDTTKTQWSAVAVPEPTSGLLLLLGMAGLALKRKRK